MKAKNRALLKTAGPAVVFGLAVVVAGLSGWQAWDTANHLRSEARETSHIYGQIVAALSDTSGTATTDALLAIVEDITAMGIPIIVTDTAGTPTAAVNLGFDPGPGDARTVSRLRAFERYSDPVLVPGFGRIYFGPAPAEQRMAWLPVVQVMIIVLTVLVAFWAWRNAVGRGREKIWVAMARESAHQLGTPLMSARAWIDRLDDRGAEVPKIAAHLRADVDRLERVAQRFERIGRPARRERVALGATAERVAGYFRPRLPRHANQVSLEVRAPGAGPVVRGDQVLIEWALESLIRNAIDALSGRGGRITVSVGVSSNEAVVTVADDGPGIEPSMRAGIFEPGVTTKTGGWGIGLPLARRIFEEVHGGRLTALDSDVGAVFQGTIPLEDDGSTE